MYKKERISLIIVTIARLLLALTLLFSGMAKGIDPVGGGLKMEEYLRTFGLSGLRPYATTLSLLLNSFEFTLGALLLMGVWRKLTAWLALLFMGIMTLISLYLALFNPIADCGCFGDALHLTNWQTFAKNVPLLLSAIIFFCYKHRIKPLFRSKRSTLVMVALALGGILFFNYRNLRYLPIMDFRPFKVGASLQDLVLVPDGAPQDEYEYAFIYEKNGVKQTFLMDSLPDDSWNYVERHEQLVRKGYRPPVADFALFSEGREVTDLILHNSGPMIWILSPNWHDANRSVAGRINRLYETASAKGILVFAVSGSDPTNVERWRNATAAKYNNILLDATTVKTIIRSNPGLMFVENGVIRSKESAFAIPTSNTSLDRFIDRSFSENRNITLRALFALAPLLIWVLCVLLAFLLPRRNA